MNRPDMYKGENNKPRRIHSSTLEYSNEEIKNASEAIINRANILMRYIRSRYLEKENLALNRDPDYYNLQKYLDVSDRASLSVHKHSDLSYDDSPDDRKIKVSLSRRPITHKDISTYVDEEIIKSTYDQFQTEQENNYTICNQIEKDDLYKIFNLANISINNLIEWGDLYHKKERTKCGSIDLKRLWHLKKPLQELDKMIGLNRFKANIVEQILMCLQDLHQNKNEAQEMYHTVIYGPPGVGKTQLAKILGHIYIAMGLMHKRKVDLSRFNIEDYFETASRSDLVGMYCGHTAVQTQKIIDRCRKSGKVLFIDETYSLGGERSDKDNFSKECIDTINKNLTEGAGEFICIIAGYPEDIKKCFFSHNKGLERRFNFRYTIDKYSSTEMRSIFILKLEENGWSLSDREAITNKFFENNEEYFLNV